MKRLILATLLAVGVSGEVAARDRMAQTINLPRYCR